MQIRGKTVIAQLRKESTWLQSWKKIYWGRESVENRAANLIIGCFYILSQHGTDVASWVARHPHREALVKGGRAIRTEDGRQAMAELIELTISAVAALPSAMYSTGPLDCSRPPRSRAQIAAARRGLEVMNRKAA